MRLPPPTRPKGVVEFDVVTRVVQSPSVAEQVLPGRLDIAMSARHLDLSHRVHLMAEALRGSFQRECHTVRGPFGIARITQEYE